MIKIETLVERAAHEFNVTPEQVMSHSRLTEHLRPRQAVYLVAIRAGYNNAQIARAMGKDRTAVRRGAEVACEHEKRSEFYRGVIERVAGQ